jgi:hypothetical protein
MTMFDRVLNKIRVSVLGFLAIFTLAACATPASYMAATRDGAMGYSEERIETDRWRVTYQGNAVTDVRVVEDYVLYRAAELATSQGFDYFIVASRTTTSEDSVQRYGPARSSSFLAQSYYYPRYGWVGYVPAIRDPYFDDFSSYREVSRYKASAEVSLFRGSKPTENAMAYNARDVLATVGPRVTRPQSR